MFDSGSGGSVEGGGEGEDEGDEAGGLGKGGGEDEESNVTSPF